MDFDNSGFVTQKTGSSAPPFHWEHGAPLPASLQVGRRLSCLYEIARADVGYIMGMLPIVRRHNEEHYGEYRTKRVILEVYDEIRRAIATGVPYQTRLDPPPADPRCCHPAQKGGGMTPSTKTEFDYQFELVTQEIGIVREAIEGHNRSFFTIKGWAITVLTGFLIYAAQTEKPPLPLALAMIVVLILFWVQDCVFKSIQNVYIKRSAEIEAFFQGPNFAGSIEAGALVGLKTPNIEGAFADWLSAPFSRVLKVAFLPTIGLVYGSMILVVVLVVVVGLLM